MRPDYVVLLELDENGQHAVILDVVADSVLWITDSYPTAHQAEMAALAWVDSYLADNRPARSARPNGGTRSKRHCKRRRKR